METLIFIDLSMPLSSAVDICLAYNNKDKRNHSCPCILCDQNQLSFFLIEVQCDFYIILSIKSQFGQVQLMTRRNLAFHPMLSFLLF